MRWARSPSSESWLSSARADVLCAPSLGGESFGMILTEAFAASTPVLASDIPGYRDVVRDGVDGQLVARGDPLALAEALRRLRARAAAPRAHGRGRARARRALRLAARRSRSARQPTSRRSRWRPARRRSRHAVARRAAPRLRAGRPAAARAGPAPALAGARAAAAGRSRAAHPHAASRRPGRVLAGRRRAGRALRCSASASTRVAASLLASKPGLLVAGLALMCAAMFTRAIAWHAILAAAPTWRRAKRRDAMQGTFIGVLMSSTLPARLGEPSRALIVARRLGPRARDAAGGARHDGLADAAEPARAGDPRRRHAVERQRAGQPLSRAAAGRPRAAGRAAGQRARADPADARRRARARIACRR